jgi:Mg2+ and Co2+ transporter CorA
VFYGARAGRGGEDRPELGEVECVISGSFIVTVRHGPCVELDALHETIGAARGGEQFVVYRVLDTLTDTLFPVLASIDDNIETRCATTSATCTTP